MPLTDRQKALLEAVIEEYVQSAEPVSSKLLTDEGIFDLSPATIRSEMSELERKGYLAHLHTSGGRIPTDKAYRHYVDSIEVGNFKLGDKYRKKIHEAIEYAKGDPRELNRILANVLSELSGNMVITNIVGSRDYSKAGLSDLFAMPEFQEFERIFGITSFFEEFEELFDGLHREMIRQHNEVMQDETIRIMIGQESPFNDTKNDTVIQSEYMLPRRCKGSITLIGPTRMDYGKNLSLVRCTVEELNKIFS
ncbi:MAG: hypothetical protein ABH833_01730 [Parcubacteria group bacterium]